MAEERFELTNDPPPHRPWRGHDAGPERQGMLFTGLDQLPGQQDLFSTDYVSPDREDTGDDSE